MGTAAIYGVSDWAVFAALVLTQTAQLDLCIFLTFSRNYLELLAEIPLTENVFRKLAPAAQVGRYRTLRSDASN